MAFWPEANKRLITWDREGRIRGDKIWLRDGVGQIIPIGCNEAGLQTRRRNKRVSSFLVAVYEGFTWYLVLHEHFEWISVLIRAHERVFSVGKASVLAAQWSRNRSDYLLSGFHRLCRGHQLLWDISVSHWPSYMGEEVVTALIKAMPCNVSIPENNNCC